MTAIHLPSTTPNCLPVSVHPPYFLLTVLATSVRSTSLSLYVAAWRTAWNSNRSWPAPAEASAARRAGMSALRMWSIFTSTLFLSPQSLAYLSNQSSYAGTKWLQRRILSDAPDLGLASGAAWPAG